MNKASVSVYLCEVFAWILNNFLIHLRDLKYITTCKTNLMTLTEQVAKAKLLNHV